ncbi:MAG TPA: exodeoxyribonuclease VII large subunit [Candidatus Saccharimonadales bacterium]|nr:exodeoxyribonuclease VII large subunit [Candidatus Saccharimonadales bacterium]
MIEPIELGVSDFVSLLNQTLAMAYPEVIIKGELANFRVSKNQWVYFDLKDDISSVKFFGTVYNLPGPLEEGMLLRVKGQPRLHAKYGFSINVMLIQPTGEGSIKKAAQLLQAKLTAEGLFDESRKRLLPYPPSRIGLITSKQSAAYSDFIKIINARWRGVRIQLVDVKVQGESAPLQITEAIQRINSEAEPPEVVVIIRGGGSAEDLAAFNTEQVTRAIAVSRVPTLVAIGHEIDWSLAELAADRRASTPSNAAELLVPDWQRVKAELTAKSLQLNRFVNNQITSKRLNIAHHLEILDQALNHIIRQAVAKLTSQQQILSAINPDSILKRGYAIVRQNKRPVRSISSINSNNAVNVQLIDGEFQASVIDIHLSGGKVQ